MLPHTSRAAFLFSVFCVFLNRVWLSRAFSSSSSLSNSQQPFEDYQSRSTASPEQSSDFSEGIEERRKRLHESLLNLGVDPSLLIDSPDEAGTAAVRAYTSFLLPKSPGAFAVTQTPTRASTVANNISFLIREYQSHQEEWLRNHDRTLAEAAGHPRQPLTLVLDNLRSAANVGNILRAAETANIENVVMAGITPSPPHPSVLKTAVGAAEYVPFESVPSTLEAVRDLQKQGVTVVGVETTSRSIPLWDMDFTTMSPVALVLGNEMVGVDVSVLNACDTWVCIPTRGVKNSLNVGNCAAIVMWEVLRQWERYGRD